MVLFEGWCLCISLAEHIKPLQTINSNISLRHLSHDSLLWPFFGGPLQRGTWLFYFEGDFEVDFLKPANLLIPTELNPLNGAVPHWSNFTDNNWGNLVKTFSDFHSHSQAQFCTFTADLLVPDSRPTSIRIVSPHLSWSCWPHDWLLGSISPPASVAEKKKEKTTLARSELLGPGGRDLPHVSNFIWFDAAGVIG